MDRQTDDFAAFVADCEQQLRGTALLLTGDPAEADDLVVAALARTHRRWRRLDSPAAALTDTRATLVAASLGRTRLPPTGTGTIEDPADGDRLDDSDRRWLQALADLDPLTRAVTVLRLHEGQDDDAVAALLGWSPEQVADALAGAVGTLELLLADEPLPEPTPPATPLPGPAAAVPATATVAGAVLAGGGPTTGGDLDGAFRRPVALDAAPAVPAATTSATGTTSAAAVTTVGQPAAGQRPPAAPVAGGDADAVFRRPGVDAADPATPRPPTPGTPVSPSAPDVGTDVSPTDDDRNAIYRRPT